MIFVFGNISALDELLIQVTGPQREPSYAPEFIPKITFIILISHRPTRGLTWRVHSIITILKKLQRTSYTLDSCHRYRETDGLPSPLQRNSWITVITTDLAFLVEDIAIHISIQILHIAAPFMFIQRANKMNVNVLQ